MSGAKRVGERACFGGLGRGAYAKLCGWGFSAAYSRSEGNGWLGGCHDEEGNVISETKERIVLGSSVNLRGSIVQEEMFLKLLKMVFNRLP